MSVRPRGESYEATVHFKGERYRKTFPTKLQAESWELQTKADLKQGKILTQGNAGDNHESGPRNLKDLLDMTARKYWSSAKAGTTAIFNASSCIEFLGRDLHPSRVDSIAIDNLIFHFEQQGLAPATINRRLSALSRMLTFAYDRRFITHVPKIERKKEPEHRVRFITEDEEAELLAYYKFIGNYDMVDLIMLGVDTGMRLGEIRRLAPRYVDYNTGLITIHESKSNKPRYIPMTKRVATLLTRRGEALEDRSVPYWAGWTNSKIRHLWQHGKSHLKMMDDAQFVPHTMRHTFCSRLVQRGVDILSVKELAGHSSVTVTMRYSHLKPDNLVAAIRALEGLPKEDAA